jgi:hypothetical protein
LHLLHLHKLQKTICFDVFSIMAKIAVNWVRNPKFNISSNSSITSFCISSKRITLFNVKSIIQVFLQECRNLGISLFLVLIYHQRVRTNIFGQFFHFFHYLNYKFTRRDKDYYFGVCPGRNLYNFNKGINRQMFYQFPVWAIPIISRWHYHRKVFSWIE